MWKYLILILPLFVSCVTKKVAVSSVKEDVKTDSTVVERKDSAVVQQNAIIVKEETHEIEVVPIDTAKPIIIGDKPYFNATVKIRKKKKELVDTTKTVVVKSEEKKTEVQKEEKKKSFVKSVDKKPSYFNLWWLLLILLAVWLGRRYLIK